MGNWYFFFLNATASAPRISKRAALRLGFATVIGLLVLSTAQTYRIQQTQSRQAMEIYRRHVEQDVTLYELRRSIWLAAMTGRDFLISPESVGASGYASQLRGLRQRADRLQQQFDHLAAEGEFTARLRLHLDAFWSSLEAVPGRATAFSPSERFQLVQQEIVPRRNAAGDTLREFAEMTQKALHASETAFEANQKEASTRLQILLGFTVFVGILVAWISLSHSEALERATETHIGVVEQARRELQLLTARLLSIQEEERTRLSREMHDEIGQALATIRLEIVRTEIAYRGSFPEAAERLARARDLAERTVATVRDMSAMLRPPVLDDLGLLPALRGVAEEFAARTGVCCLVDLPAEIPPLTEELASCVYRVVQEALHNCEKHASASKVLLRASQEDSGQLTVEVRDDGSGFDASNQTRPAGVRLGLLGMKERATAAGGRLEVESAPGMGTSIRLTMPLELAAAPMDSQLALGTIVI